MDEREYIKGSEDRINFKIPNKQLTQLLTVIRGVGLSNNKIA